MKEGRDFLTQLALCERLVAVARVATGWISLAKIFMDNAQAIKEKN